MPTTTKSRKHLDNDLQSSLLDPTDKNFVYDEIDEFEDNEDHVTLQQAKKMMERRDVPREQVLGIDGSSSDEDDDDDEDELSEESDENKSDPDELFMEDDIVDEPEFKLPDERAWGSKKHRYFGTDTTDEKIQWKLYNQDEEIAQLEEETARKLQERMAAELKDLVSDDLILQTEDKGQNKDDFEEDLVETDLSALSRSRKLQLLKRESPEFLPLIEDLKSKCEELRCILSPLMEEIRMGKIPEGPVHQYITTKYRLVLNYVSMISVYMMAKCSTKSVRDHPVVGRLAQYRQLLQELEPCDNKLALHLGQLLDKISEAEDTSVKSLPKVEKERPRKRKKELQLLNKNKSAKIEEKKKQQLMSLLKEPVESDDKKPMNDKSKRKGDTTNVLEASSDEEQETQEPEKEEASKELDPDEKRSIGYGIAKNKGLMPYRRKDQRNPRVRYRNKYAKKLKRRKGQVQGVRKELERYGGEMTGIKSHTVKSIKIKS